MGPTSLAQVVAGRDGEATRKRARVPRARGWRGWVSEPRNAVLLLLGGALFVGGGRKVLEALRSRAAVGRLEDENVSPGDVEAASEHGRAGLMELFRLLGSTDRPAVRDAAGRALAVLWRKDELIAEEEKAVVRRGFEATWKARRRYPRAVRAEIPVSVRFGVPFLTDDPRGVRPSNLEWSYRVVGAKRASLEAASPWAPGPASADFSIVPGDFDADGPHKLVVQPRVRTVGLTESWELDLPHVAFSFEFDPILGVDAIFAAPDDARGKALAHAVRLVPGAGAEPAFLPLNDRLSVRGVPVLEIRGPLPCDLAHAVELEIEGVPGRFAAGSLVVVEGQGGATARRLPVGPIERVPDGALDRPGPARVRARLTADPDLGWAAPDVRSVWPGTIETDWVGVEVVRH